MGVAVRRIASALSHSPIENNTMALTLNSRSYGVHATAPYRLSVTVGTTRTIKSSASILRGVFFAAASSSPTLSIVDGIDGSGDTLIGTFTPVAATYYNLGDSIAKTGIYITTAGTVDLTLFYF